MSSLPRINVISTPSASCSTCMHVPYLCSIPQGMIEKGDYLCFKLLVCLYRHIYIAIQALAMIQKCKEIPHKTAINKISPCQKKARLVTMMHWHLIRVLYVSVHTHLCRFFRMLPIIDIEYIFATSKKHHNLFE